MSYNLTYIWNLKRVKLLKVKNTMVCTRGFKGMNVRDRGHEE